MADTTSFATVMVKRQPAFETAPIFVTSAWRHVIESPESSVTLKSSHLVGVEIEGQKRPIPVGEMKQPEAPTSAKFDAWQWHPAGAGI